VKSLEQHFFELKKSWPSTLVARDQVGKFSGGIISSKYIANLDCRGLGPVERLRIGRKVVYPVNSLVDWLASKSKILKSEDQL
jgi:hypothetical protein